MFEEYRRMVVSRFSDGAESIDVGFESSCVGLVIRKDYLVSKNIDWSRIKRGSVLFIKGRRGNDDVVLASADPIEDIYLE